LPRARTGEPTPTTLAISIDVNGRTYLDGAPIAEILLRHKVRQARRETPDARAVLAADGKTRHQAVIDVIDLLRQEGVTRFAVNVQPHDPRDGNKR
jgi:biopolymer transport protein ExbD